MPPKISVIVPVYKVEKYLQKCIDSILAQTFADFELLLIDDGSPDNSGKICDEYAKNDTRIKVFHKENGGVSSARNLGIRESQGKYLVFWDSDDTVPNDTLNILYSNIERQDMDLVVGETYTYTYWKEVVLDERRHAIKNGIWQDKKGIYEMFCMLYDTSMLAALWNKMFRSERVKEMKEWFDCKLTMWEDEDFIIRYLTIALSCMTICDIVYFQHYRFGMSASGKFISGPEERYKRRVHNLHVFFNTMRCSDIDISHIEIVSNCVLFSSACPIFYEILHKDNPKRIGKIEESIYFAHYIESIISFEKLATINLPKQKKMVLYLFQFHGVWILPIILLCHIYYMRIRRDFRFFKVFLCNFLRGDNV